MESLLMGGQACILYGAAEFSRDADLAIHGTTNNLAKLSAALAALDARVIAVPPFETGYLERGHAVHFRCERDDVRGLRVDVMSRMRGVDSFAILWERRSTFGVSLPGEEALDIDVLSLPDLVAAKKTQRDKDWPMIRRLVEANYFESREQATSARLAFWFAEMRTPELLIECARAFPLEAGTWAEHRAAVAAAVAGDAGNVERIEQELALEQTRERALDRAYWAPLRAELEQLRRARRE